MITRRPGAPHQATRRRPDHRRTAVGTARLAALVLAIGLAGGGCVSPGYEGPGTDHPFVGRRTGEIEPCAENGCNGVGVNAGRLDGVVVRVAWRRGEQTFSDLACRGDRLNLAVDGDEIVAAWPDDC